MQTQLLSIGTSEGASVSEQMMEAILTVADGCVLPFLLPFPPSLPPTFFVLPLIPTFLVT